MEPIRAVVRGTPIRFHIHQRFAEECLHTIGSVVRHPTLGPIFCEEAVVAENGTIDTLVFLGTSNQNGLRR